ncbi:hypothetical protein N7451_012384 [Penicillium sp. IBT 35674x]|nr:hypothetical protein N7451_012384 [Penicillium sp. IBT 35674x]
MAERMRIEYILNQCEEGNLSDAKKTFTKRPPNFPQSDCQPIQAARDDQRFDSREHAASSSNRNTVKAIRLCEVVNDFRTLERETFACLHSLLSMAVCHDHYSLRRWHEAATQLLHISNFLNSNESNRNITAQFDMFMLDACARRFLAFRLYRTVVTRHYAYLRQIDAATEASHGEDLSAFYPKALLSRPSLSDTELHAELQQMDHNSGYWLQEDPSLDDIVSLIQSKFKNVLGIISS